MLFDVLILSKTKTSSHFKSKKPVENFEYYIINLSIFNSYCNYNQIISKKNKLTLKFLHKL